MEKHILLMGLGLFDDYVGGISAYETNLTRVLQNHDYRVSAMIPRTRPGLPQKTTVEGVDIYRYGSAQGGLRTVFEQWREARSLFRSILKSQQVTLLNVHFALSAWGALQVPESCKIPKLMHYHGPWPLEWKAQRLDQKPRLSVPDQWMNTVQTSIERNVVKQMDALILMSQAFVPYIKESYGIAPEKIHVLPIPWDPVAQAPLEESREEIRKRLNIPREQKLLLCVRRLVKRTGVDMLLDAIAPLCSAYPNLSVHIVGTGPEEETLKRQAKALRLPENQVQFRGFVPDNALRELYRAADLSCVPTRSLEGFGIIILESLVQGTPVIVTPVGGMPEVVAPLAPQLITDAATAHSLQDKLEAWLSGNLLLPEGPRCRQYVTESFHWDRVFPRMESIMNTLTV